MASRGERCVIVRPGDAFEREADLRFRIRSCDEDDVQRLLVEAVPAGAPPCRGVIHLWSLDVPALDDDPTAVLDRAHELGCGSVLALMHKLIRTGWAAVPQLWLVTRGAMAVTKDQASVAVAQSPLWGMARVLAVEHPEFHTVRIDLDLQKDAG